MEDGWPELFGVMEMPKMIFAFLGLSECRDWIINSECKFQTQICQWKPLCLQDVDVKKALLCKKNELVIRAITTADWAMILEIAEPLFLDHILQTTRNKPPLRMFATRSIPLNNLQILVNYIPIGRKTMVNSVRTAFHQKNRPLLEWLLSDPRWQGPLDLPTNTTITLLKIVLIDIFFGDSGLLDLALQLRAILVAHLLKMLRPKDRHKLFCDQCTSIDLASILWKPDYHFYDFPQINPAPIFELDCRVIEHAFAFVLKNPGPFSDALLNHLCDLFCKRPFEQKCFLFEQFPIVEMPLFTKWLVSSCSELEQEHFKNRTKHWHLTACESLTKPIVSGYFLNVWTLLLVSGLFSFDAFSAALTSAKLSFECVLSRLWPTHRDHWLNIKDDMTRFAIQTKDDNVLRFLSTHDALGTCL